MRSVLRSVSMEASSDGSGRQDAYLLGQSSSTCHSSPVSKADVRTNTFNLPMCDKYAGPPLIQQSRVDISH